MADHSTCAPLEPASIAAAHKLIKPHVHLTPTVTSKTLDRIASTPQSPEALIGTPFEGKTPAKPVFRLYFKCENQQRIGAFKARGAFHAVLHLIEELGIEEVRRKGVVTHSSGNHAQALALAASAFNIPANIVMPTISTSSKIAGTKSQGANVIFSGSTSVEREAVVEEVIKETGAILVPPYDHPDIILGQGTTGLELEQQVIELLASKNDGTSSEHPLNAVFTPLGGGGLLSGVATHFSQTPNTYVFGAEPSFQGGDDGRRGLAAGKRIEAVSTLTIADGLRTPVGKIPWTVISDKKKVRGVFAVTEEQIKAAMKLVLERMKVFVEPSAVVGLAVCLFDEEFRAIVEKEGGEKGWDVGIVFSGGNTTIEAIVGLFGEEKDVSVKREEGTIGLDGKAVAENIAG